MPAYRRHIAEQASFDDLVAALADDERALPVAG